ncbi:hypothetical protein CEXT_811021 [Caerostris extrusa]|uniref:Uncharacterized protein n=1 Tax=Caerostris extrusa TaxID=172846 RepID=A0AAV4Q934_CAEEX|nr:hypothetical protein CEXT_811021 [Caerostris extrusa]
MSAKCSCYKSVICDNLIMIMGDCELIICTRTFTYINGDPNDMAPLTITMFNHGGSKIETSDFDSVERSLSLGIKYFQKLRENLGQRFKKGQLVLLRFLERDISEQD